MERCKKRYGKRRQFVCKRLAGHAGTHALRLSAREMSQIVGRRTKSQEDA